MSSPWESCTHECAVQTTYGLQQEILAPESRTAKWEGLDETQKFSSCTFRDIISKQSSQILLRKRRERFTEDISAVSQSRPKSIRTAASSRQYSGGEAGCGPVLDLPH